jgi:hypothetical protein
LEKNETDAKMGREPLVPPSRSERAEQAWRDEKLLKLDKRVEGLAEEVKQYRTLVDEHSIKLENVGKDIQEAFAMQNQTVKKYIDEKLGTPAQPGTAQKPAQGGLGGLVDRIFEGERGNQLVDRLINGIIPGGSPSTQPALSMGGEIVDLERQSRHIFEENYRRQLRTFVNQASKELGLPVASNVQVIHKT